MRYRLIAATLLSLGMFLFGFTPACTHAAQASPDTPIRATLDGLADAINPASHIAADGCRARKESITVQAENHTLDKQKAGELLEQAIARCKTLERTFDRLRELHDQARVLIEHDELARAQDKLTEIREAWRGLDDTPGGAP